MPHTCCMSFINFTGSLQLVKKVATNLSISSSCNKCVKISLDATCYLQTCYNLLKQLSASLWITSFNDQLETSLLTTCNKLVVNNCRRPCERILMLKIRLLQDAKRLAVYFIHRIWNFYQIWCDTFFLENQVHSLW